MATKRTYTIPLRRAFLKAPKYRRAKRAITEVRSFLQRHMKSEDVSIGKHLNEYVWSCGIRNPPHHVKVDVTKDDDGKVKAELFGAPVEEPKEEKKTKGKKKEAKGLEAIKAELEGKLKKEEKKEKKEAKEEKKSEVKEEAKAEEKKETKKEEKAKPEVKEDKPK